MDPSPSPQSTLEAPRQVDRTTTERLLDTAASLFWEKGYAATTTREIAAAVGIQQASLYHHMANKEDLLYRICISSLNEFLTAVEPVVNEAGRPVDRVKVLIRTHVSTLLAHNRRNATMLTELRSLTPRHRVEVVALRKNYASFVRATLKSAQAAGAIRNDIAAEYLCLALFNLLNWSALWFQKDRAMSPDQLADVFVGIFLEGSALAPARASLAPPDFETRARRTASRARKTAKTPENYNLERLLEAAVALFSRKGYTATSTREVAALLGIQKASLYYHIGSKEDLLYGICRASLEQIRMEVETAVTDVLDPLERTRVLIRTHVESMLRQEEMHATTLAEMHALSAERFSQVLALRHAYEDVVRSVLHEAQKAGAVRADIDVKYLCLSLLGMMNRVLVWYRRGGALSPAQIGELLAVIFLTGASA